MWCFSYNCVLHKILICIQGFPLSSFMEKQTGNRTRVIVEEGCLNLFFAQKAKRKKQKAKIVNCRQGDSFGDLAKLT